MYIGMSEKVELDYIARNLSEKVLNGEYSINEACFEVLLTDYNLCNDAVIYVRERVQIITGEDMGYE